MNRCALTRRMDLGNELRTAAARAPLGHFRYFQLNWDSWHRYVHRNRPRSMPSDMNAAFRFNTRSVP